MRTPALLLGLCIGLAGLGLNLAAILPASMRMSRSLPAALVDFWTYFTHLTNLGLLLVYLAELAGWRWLGWFRRPTTQALMAGYILLVMLYYHFMLAPMLNLPGMLGIASVVLHYVAPIFYLGWWAAFSRHGQLQYGHIPAMLVPGFLYVAWALGRGALTGIYPYDILDAGRFGYLAVGIGVLTLVGAVVVFCALVVTADRLLGAARR